MTSVRPATRHDVLPAWVWLAVFAVLALGVTALLTTPGVSVAVTIPLVVQVVATCTLVAVLWRRRRGLVPWFEIGVVYSGIVTLYGVYPLLRFLAVGDHYSAPEYRPAVDAARILRVPRWSTSDGSTHATSWRSLRPTSSCAAACRCPRAPLRPPRTSVFIAVVAIYVLVQGFWLYLGLFYDTSAGSYLESYLVSRRLPLLLAQLLNHLNGAKYPLSLVILTGLFARYAANRRYIAAWIGAIAVVTFARLGSRTELALLVLAAGMMYHTLVRPVPPRAVVAGVSAGIAGFVVLGMLRGGTGATDGGMGLSPFLYASEFDVLFGNAVELARARAAGTLGSVPWALYFADLAALLPQQIAPFEKIEPAGW